MVDVVRLDLDVQCQMSSLEIYGIQENPLNLIKNTCCAEELKSGAFSGHKIRNLYIMQDIVGY